jgi:glycosyltransferase involved in cell wall biosynthesis
VDVPATNAAGGGHEVVGREGDCRVVVDGIEFQNARTGIARVWESVLDEWSRTDFAAQLVVLDRGRTPRHAGLRYREIPPYRFADPGAIADEPRLLQDLCDEEGADVFVSTYYTFPATTPSVFLCHDMIPEKFGHDLGKPMWRLKHLGIRHAASFVCVSGATARDLKAFLDPQDARPVTIAWNGVHGAYRRAPAEDVQPLLRMLGIAQPYLLLVGADRCGTHKNPELLFDALTLLPAAARCAVVCTGAYAPGLVDEVRSRYPQIADRVVAAQLTQKGLAAAYSGAAALVYPSRYEGFGLPVLEAMACECPVVACPVASIPEIAGDLVDYVDPDDPRGLSAVLTALLARRAQPATDPALQQRLQRARAHAQRFTWASTAAILRDVLLRTARLNRPSRPTP